MNCSVLSTTPLSFKWKKDNTEVDSSHVVTTSFRPTLSNNTITIATLNLNNIEMDNAGRYQCIITNRFGTIYSQKAVIEVACK